ncbi:MAG: penicillin-binding protein [Clostridia bacterium]|nr:penicillin-binding protein [Clostridia bacterium]
MSENSNYGSTKRYNVNQITDKLSDNANKKSKVKNNKSQYRGNKKPNKVWKVVKIILITILVLGILAGIILAGVIAGLFLGLFGNDFKLTRDDLVISYLNSEVYNADGKLVATLTGDEKRKVVSMSQMSKYLPKAYVAIEDERFYKHTGVDVKRTAAATITYALHGGKSSFGGSTITQQLVKNVTKDNEDTATRKIKEMAKALQVEKIISKDEILELYLNIIFVGGNSIHGVALGSEYYFSKNVSKLSLAECAYLAGINNSPNMYHPFSKKSDDINKIKIRTKTVLDKMLELKYINKDEYDKAVAEVDKGLKFKKGKLNSGQIYSYITESAIDEIVNQLVKEKGMSKELAKMTVYGGGLKIYTTEKPSYQKIMSKEMAKEKYVRKSSKHKKTTSQAAMVMIDQKNGQVVACMGKLGKKTTNGDLNRCTDIYKQTGSSFKPLSCVAPGIQEGVVTAASGFVDKAVKYSNGKVVRNYDRKYRGNMNLRNAIAISCNTVQVQIIQKLGVKKSVEYLKKMGFSHLTDKEGEAIALGGLSLGAEPIEMAAAYATIANGGTYIEPTFYKKVVDSKGNTILKPKQKKTKVLSEEVAFIVTDILKEPVTAGNGTARYCKISGIDTAAKTGTTNSNFDRWLCGFTPYYTAAVWYGYDDAEEVHYSGTNPAGLIWSEVMKKCHAKLKNKSFKKPDGVIRATVCSKTGLLPGGACKKVTDYFVKGTLPKKKCTGHSDSDVRKVLICSETGLLAIEGACPHIDVVTFDKDDKDIPTKYCNKHKKKNPTPSNKKNETNTVTPDPAPTNEVKPDPAPVNNTVVEEPDPDTNETTGT